MNSTAPIEAVGVGASFGGLDAIRVLLARLPSDFPAAILLVQHRSAYPLNLLSDLLRVSSRLPIVEAADGDPIRAGQVYVCPVDFHCTISKNRTIELSQGAKVNFVRPAIDVLFQSISQRYRNRALGLVLTGNLYDGAAGIRTMKAAGSITIVQDRGTAKSYDMPSAAIRTGNVDFILPIDVIADALATLVMLPGASALFSGKMPPELLQTSELDAGLTRPAPSDLRSTEELLRRSNALLQRSKALIERVRQS